MSTNLFDNGRVSVTRFACGQCRTKGPCFQITGSGSKNGDYAVVHREDASDVVSAIFLDMGFSTRQIELFLAQKK